MIVPGGSNEALINTVFLSVLDGLKRRLGEHRLDLAIFLESGTEDRLGALRRVTERGLADALIIADTESLDPRVEYLLGLGKPFVTFGRTKASARHAWVDPDFEGAVAGAIGHLVALGHRRIGLALPDLRTHYLELLETGYRNAMRARGLAVDGRWNIRRPTGEQGGLEAAEALLGTDPRPSAILVSESMHAVALYRRLSEAGLNPGRDISILGLLPEARAQYLIPTLTTYQTDWTEIGRRLADAAKTEMTLAVADRDQKISGSESCQDARMQYKMAVAFSAGESVQRVDSNA